MMWHIIGIFAFVVIYNIWRYYHEDDSYDDNPVETDTSDSYQVIETAMEETISTRQLALNIIEHIGSVPKYTDEGRIQFEYQGVIFLMETANDCDFVNLIWPWCYSFNKFDIDEFARVCMCLTFGSKRSPEGHLHKKRHLREIRKCLIFNVDQPGLEPGTSSL